MSSPILPRTGILSFMDDESREQLASYGSMITTAPGDVIIKEGEPNVNLYIVLGGKFNITTHSTGREVHLDVVGLPMLNCPLGLPVLPGERGRVLFRRR